MSNVASSPTDVANDIDDSNSIAEVDDSIREMDDYSDFPYTGILDNYDVSTFARSFSFTSVLTLSRNIHSQTLDAIWRWSAYSKSKNATISI